MREEKEEENLPNILLLHKLFHRSEENILVRWI